MSFNGTRLGPYRLIRRLSSDGMASRYTAHRQGPHGFRRSVEIVALHAPLSANVALARTFARSATLFAHLSATRHVPVEDLGTDSGCIYRVSPLCGLSPSLPQLRRLTCPLSVFACSYLVAELALARIELRGVAVRLGLEGGLRFDPSDAVIARDGRVRVRCPWPSPAIHDVDPRDEVRELATLLRDLLGVDRPGGSPSALPPALGAVLAAASSSDPEARPAHAGVLRKRLFDFLGPRASDGVLELSSAARRLALCAPKGEAIAPQEDDETTVESVVLADPRSTPPSLSGEGEPKSSAPVAGPAAALVSDAGRLDLSGGAGRWVVGRDPGADLVLADADVSREHFELVILADGAVVAYDLGSKNGLRVNGRVVDEQRLTPGDEIVAGKTKLRFQAGVY